MVKLSLVPQGLGLLQANHRVTEVTEVRDASCGSQRLGDTEVTLLGDTEISYLMPK